MVEKAGVLCCNKSILNLLRHGIQCHEKTSLNYGPSSRLTRLPHKTLTRSLVDMISGQQTRAALSATVRYAATTPTTTADTTTHPEQTEARLKLVLRGSEVIIFFCSVGQHFVNSSQYAFLLLSVTAGEVRVSTKRVGNQDQLNSKSLHIQQFRFRAVTMLENRLDMYFTSITYRHFNQIQ